MSDPRSAPRRLPPIILLAAAGFICYGASHITQLGFYHDDWAILSVLHFSKPGFFERLTALAQQFESFFFRPMDIGIYAGLYGLFRLNPEPWQITLLIVNVMLAYAVHRLLLSFRVSERWAFLGALIFLAYPNKDATMFWPVVMINSLALLCFLTAYLCQLRYVEFGEKRSLWLSGIFLLCSLATYDQCYCLFPLWLVTPLGLRDGVPLRARRGFALAAAVVAIFSIYKFCFVPYGLGVHYNKALFASPARFFSVYLDGINAAFGITLARYVLSAAQESWHTRPVLSAFALFLPWAALGLNARCSVVDRRHCPALILLGAGIFILGYLPIAFSNYMPTPINHMNRINLVPVLGLILAAVGGCQISRADLGLGRLGCVLGAVLLTSHIAFAGYWVGSYRQQNRVRELIELHRRQWRADATLLLLLPENFVMEKAPIFIESWDISGAARLWTGDKMRKADVIGDHTKFLSEGILLRPSGAVLPYDSVMLLDARNGTLTEVGNPYRGIRGKSLRSSW